MTPADRQGRLTNEPVIASAAATGATRETDTASEPKAHTEPPTPSETATSLATPPGTTPETAPSLATAPGRQRANEPDAPTVGNDARPEILAGRARRSLIHTIAFVRKETLAVVRQPRLLAVLVVGPFLLLFLFGLGYDQTQTVLRTAFVGPQDGIFEEATQDFGESLEEYVEFAGYTSDVIEAQEWLANDEIDLIVIFPADPAETVLAGDQAIIDVLHNKLDPIQQTAVNVSAQVAVQELNSRVLERVVDQAQDTTEPYQESAAASSALLDELESAAARSDEDESRRLAAELDQRSAGLASALTLTESVRATLGDDLPEDEQQQLSRLLGSIDRYQATTTALATADGELDPADVRAARTALDAVLADSETVITLDPAVAVRPFRSDAENLLRQSVTLDDFFAPSAIALLVQHMALTFAAIALVRDRSLGLFELFRVGSISAGRILLGKYLANLLVAGSVAAVLLVAVVQLIGVPFRGDLLWVGVGIVGLVTASIAAGMVLSLLARNDSQAVQYAMLSLLAGLFFGGFLLEIDAIRYPVKLISLTLPVTYGTNLLRDVMLRGIEPELFDIAGLAATSLVYGAVAWLLMHRRLRLGAR